VTTESKGAQIGRNAIRALRLTGILRMVGLTAKFEVINVAAHCARIAKRAKLKCVTLHGLRHWLASFGAAWPFQKRLTGR
jgi:hypothetical protein